MPDSPANPARAPWRTLSSRPVYANAWIRVREDVAEMPDGRTTIYGVVECPPCVGVLPFLDERTVVLVGQYRYVERAFQWEMPTGAMRPGESEEAISSKAVYRPVIGVKPPPRRITVGYGAIAAARQVWVLAAGAGKENALRRSLAAGGQTPLARVLKLRAHTRIFTDIRLEGRN